MKRVAILTAAAATAVVSCAGAVPPMPRLPRHGEEEGVEGVVVLERSSPAANYRVGATTTTTVVLAAASASAPSDDADARTATPRAMTMTDGYRSNDHDVDDGGMRRAVAPEEVVMDPRRRAADVVGNLVEDDSDGSSTTMTVIMGEKEYSPDPHSVAVSARSEETPTGGEILRRLE